MTDGRAGTGVKEDFSETARLASAASCREWHEDGVIEGGGCAITGREVGGW